MLLSGQVLGIQLCTPSVDAGVDISVGTGVDILDCVAIRILEY